MVGTSTSRYVQTCEHHGRLTESSTISVSRKNFPRLIAAKCKLEKRDGHVRLAGGTNRVFPVAHEGFPSVVELS